MSIQAEIIDYHGYKVFRTGEIVTPKGFESKGYFFTYPFSHVSIKYDGKTHKVLRAKLIYELFSGSEVSGKYIIRFKDGDCSNCAFDNLYLESRKDYVKHTPNANKRKFTKQKETRIRNSYYDENKVKRADAPSIRELAKINKCSITTIQKILQRA